MQQEGYDYGIGFYEEEFVKAVSPISQEALSKNKSACMCKRERVHVYLCVCGFGDRCECKYG